MKILKTIDQLKKWRSLQNTVGFVPTMGDLHEGHLSLISKAQKENDAVVVSIYVNPLQFNNAQDFKKYHRDSKSDLAQLKKFNVNAVFLPEDKILYPQNFQTSVVVEELQKPLCGAFRPGHFKGVATVVLKLFNLVQAQKAYFGLKDFQQCRIIAQMVQDLNVPLKLIFCPTVREQDGLAMSSRNRRLSIEERTRACSIYSALKAAAKNKKTARKTFLKTLTLCKNDRVEYFETLNGQTLEKESPDKATVFATAVWIGQTRLIDNLILK